MLATASPSVKSGARLKVMVTAGSWLWRATETGPGPSVMVASVSSRTCCPLELLIEIFDSTVGSSVRDLSASTITDVQDRLRRRVAAVPGIRAFPVPLQNMRIGSRGGAAAYQYTLTSVDQGELYANVPRLIERLKQTRGFADVTSDLTLGARQLRMSVDLDAMARTGVTMDTLRSTLYSAFGTRKIEIGRAHV